MPTLPQRTRSHEIDALAVAALQSQSPGTWVLNDQRHDYGRDFLVTVPSAAGQVGGDDFWIQLKGSDAPYYLVDGCSLSHDLSVATLNHLRLLSSPPMLAVCDVSKQERPIYWVWIDDALNDIQQRNSAWNTQESVSVRVPIANLFSATIDAIEDNVRAWHRERRVDSIIGKFVRPAIGVPTIGGAEHADVEAYAQEVLVPRLRDAQLVEVGEGGEATSYTPEQRDFNTKLREVANSLAKFRDDDARSILAQRDASSELATPRLRAAFHNSQGVLAIHAGDHQRASAEFSEAASLDPEQPTIAVNLAAVQYALFQEDQARWPLPDDWERHLTQVLEKNPQLLPAIKLRLRWTAEISGLKAASEFAHQYSLPEGPRRELLTALAEIYLFANQPREAIEALGGLEPPANGQEAWFYAIKGHSLFALAVPSAPQIGDGRLLLQGMGPGDLNFPLLAQACEATEKALSYATEQAPQHVVEEIAANAARARLLRGQHDEAIKLSLAYAARFPESKTLSGVVATAFFISGQAEKAVPYAKQALSPDDATGETYRNLILVLTAAERFDEVLQRIGEPEREGFRGEDEKNLSYQIAAIGYAENNDFAQAERCITKLREDPQGRVNAVLAEVEVRRREGKPSADLVSLIRGQLADDPKNPWVLTALIRELGWPNAQNAQEIIDAIELVTESRQLTPVEFAGLGYAYQQLGRLEDACRVFLSAIKRYPEDPRFRFEYAQILALIGDDEGGYAALREYLEAAKADPLVYRNLASLAFSTGRLDEAIKMLARALSRTTDPNEQRELNHLLWELRRRRGDPPKEVLRHVIAFGETSSEKPDDEARFLMMALMTQLTPDDLKDPVIEAARRPISERLDAFVQAHPNHQGLHAFKMPLDLSSEEQGQHLMREIAYVTLPRRIAAGQMEIAARGAPWPLCLRAPLLNGPSIFSYWEQCSQSHDYTNAIHIFYSPLDINQEATVLPIDGKVVIDINALLTLIALDLEDEIPSLFREIVVARGTRYALWWEIGAAGYGHPLARRLEEWILRHRSIVRVRTVNPDSVSEGERMSLEVLKAGVGETFVLARQLGIPLWSDEGVIRAEAKRLGGPPAFSTLSMLRALRQRRRLTLEDETKCMARLIALNYRYVPFGAEHLHAAARLLAAGWDSGDVSLSGRLHTHELMGPLLREFAEQHVTLDSLLKVTAEWWPVLLNDRNMPDTLIEEILSWIAFTVTQRLMVSGKIAASVALDRIAGQIFAAFLISAKQSGTFPRAWSVAEHCVEQAARNDQNRHDVVLLQQIPDALVELLRRSPLDRAAVAQTTYEITEHLSEPEKSLWHERFVRVQKITR